METTTAKMTALETVQQGYKYFGERNIPALIDLMDDNVVWKDPGVVGNLYKEVRKGKAEVAAFFKTLNESIKITKFDIGTLEEVNGTVYATGSLEGTGTPTGLPVDTDWAMIWKIKNGKVTYHHLYTNTYVLGKALGI